MKTCPMKCLFLAIPLGLAACTTLHWEKPGASEDQYRTDLNYCKGVSYPVGSDGMVTKEMVRRMEGCMEAHGWRKTNN